MKLGLHISDFTWDGGAAELRFKLGEIAKGAEDGGDCGRAGAAPKTN